MSQSSATPLSRCPPPTDRAVLRRWTRPRRRSSPHVVLIVLTFGTLAISILQTQVIPALPAMQRDLGTSTSAIVWTMTGFLIAAAVAAPILGRLGDMFGKRRVLLAVLMVVAVGCIVSALGESLGMLICGRVLQGAGGAIFSLGYGIVRDELPAHRIPTGLGLLSATWGIGGSLGLLSAGVLVDQFSYTGIFWSALALFAVAIVATYLYIPESALRSPAPIDWLGAALFALFVTAFLLVLGEAAAGKWRLASVGLAAVGVGGLLAWIRVELAVAQPLIDVRLLRARAVWTVNVTAALCSFGLYFTFVLVPQLAQTPRTDGGFGATVTQSAIFILPLTVVMLLAAPTAGLLAAYVDSKLTLIAGATAAGGALLFLAFAHATKTELMIGNAVTGMALGLTLASLANLIVQAVPQSQVGEASGVNAVMRKVGSAVGGQAAGGLISVGVAGDVQDDYTSAFAIGAMAFAAAVIVGSLIPRGRRSGLQRPPDATQFDQ